MFINTNIEIFLSSIAFNRSSVRDRRAVSVEWCLRLPVWNCDGLLLLSKNVTNCLWTNLSFTLDNTGNSDMGRLLHGFPASPSLGTQVTSAIFQTRANVLDLKEMFIRDVIMWKVASKLSLSILTRILSKPGALLERKFRITLATSLSVRGWDSNCTLRGRNVRSWGLHRRLNLSEVKPKGNPEMRLNLLKYNYTDRRELGVKYCWSLYQLLPHSLQKSQLFA